MSSSGFPENGRENNFQSKKPDWLCKKTTKVVTDK